MTDAVVPDPTIKDALIGLMSNAGFAATVRLYTNDVSPDRTSNDPAQFTEAAYTGYAAQNYPYTPITVGLDHHGRLAPAVISFTPPTAGGAVNVFGFFVTYQAPFGAAGRVLLASRFTTPPRVLVVGGAPLTFNLFFEDFDAGL
jgi:hypothetical protein